MRAITVRQPWACAIVYWGKNPENRSRNIAGSYRGPVLIHAGRQVDETAWHHEMVRDALNRCDDSWVLEEQLETGVVLGVADLVDVHQPTPWCSPWGDPHAGVHLGFANPRPLATPIPAKGRLGLWTPDPELVDAVLATGVVVGP